MIFLRPFLFIVLFASCLGCSVAPAAPPSSASPFAPAVASAAIPERLPEPDANGGLELGVGGRALVAPGTVLVLERVVSDSRCPVDVTCVWAGEIRIALSVESPPSEAQRESFQLSTTAPAASVRGLRFELVGAAPEPRSTRKISPADYRISLRVTAAAAGAPR